MAGSGQAQRQGILTAGHFVIVAGVPTVAAIFTVGRPINAMRWAKKSEPENATGTQPF